MNILYIEGDRDDSEVFQYAIQRVSPTIECDIACDCNEALDKLKTQKLPSIIFLDINKRHSTDGEKFLEIIKQDPILKSIPVIIYATLIIPFYEYLKLGAYGYIIKPNSFKGICNELQSILGKQLT